MSFPRLGLEPRRQPEKRALRLGVSAPSKGQGGSAAGAGGELERLQVADVVRIEEHESYSVAKDMDPFLAHVLDQDTNIMRWQREGMYASEKGAETLSIYQESRIRHVHQTLDKYLND